jgi:Family of unknown function (DUF5678)
MPTVPAIDLTGLLKDVARGSWVAISSDETHVVASGPDMQVVIDTAKRLGEQTPIITRVPEQASTLVL